MPLHERDALATNIEKQGQLVPIVLLDGKIIDGRNRYLACLSRNIEPKIIHLKPADPKEYVSSMNYFRKHWTTAERAHWAALMSMESEVGSPPDLIAPNGAIPSVEPHVTQESAAKQMGVSRRSVQRAKAKIEGKHVNKTTGTSKKASGSVSDSEVDANGIDIPDGARPYWNRRTEAKAILVEISKIKGEIKKLEPSDPMWAGINLNGVLSDLNSAYNRFAASVPAHVCPYCKGVKPENCKGCKSKGVVSAYFYKMAPEELRK